MVAEGDETTEASTGVERDTANLWQHTETKIWYIRKMIRGERRCASTQETSLTKARDKRNILLGRWEDGRGSDKKSSPTVQAWWEVFSKGELARRPPLTQKLYRTAIAHLSPRMLRRRIADVPKSACVAELRALEKAKYAASTIKTTAACYRRVFQAAIEDELFDRNPWKGIELAKSAPRIRVLLPEEEARFLAALRPHHARWFQVLLGSGLRISELLALSVGAIRWEHEIMGVLGKGRKWREVPLSEGVMKLLRAQIAERGIAQRPQAKLWREHAVTLRQQLQRTGKRLAIVGVTPHTLRHTFATRFIEADGNIYMLSKILGHASVTITEQIYIHESSSSLVAELKRVARDSADGNNLATRPETRGI